MTLRSTIFKDYNAYALVLMSRGRSDGHDSIPTEGLAFRYTPPPDFSTGTVIPCTLRAASTAILRPAASLNVAATYTING